MQTDKRIIREVYHLETSTGDGTLKIKFLGKTTHDNYIQFTVELRWSFWAYLANEVLKVWTGVRVSKVNEITRIDNSLPKN